MKRGQERGREKTLGERRPVTHTRSCDNRPAASEQEGGLSSPHAAV